MLEADIFIVALAVAEADMLEADIFIVALVVAEADNVVALIAIDKLQFAKEQLFTSSQIWK